MYTIQADMYTDLVNYIAQVRIKLKVVYIDDIYGQLNSTFLDTYMSNCFLNLGYRINPMLKFLHVNRYVHRVSTEENYLKMSDLWQCGDDGPLRNHWTRFPHAQFCDVRTAQNVTFINSGRYLNYLIKVLKQKLNINKLIIALSMFKCNCFTSQFLCLH